MKFLPLTLQNVAALKGVAILSVVLHNYFHNLPPLLGENQFVFSEGVVWRNIAFIQQHPEQAVRLLFSYFGHMGADIFAFLSAYGLTRKYLKAELDPREFFARRFGRIYYPFLLCIVVYIGLGLVKEHLGGEKVLYWDSIIWKVTLLSNFIPNQAMKPVGPWWFVSFIFQVYAVFPILLSGFRKHGSGLLVATSILAIAFEYLANPILIGHGLNLNQMVFGHLPMLCLAIYVASLESADIPLAIVGLAALLFVAGNFNGVLWMATDTGLLLMILAATGPLFSFLRRHQLLEACLAFFGRISYPLFLVHGFLRSLVSNAVSLEAWWGDTAKALLFVAFSAAFASCFACLERCTRSVLLSRKVRF